MASRGADPSRAFPSQPSPRAQTPTHTRSRNSATPQQSHRRGYDRVQLRGRGPEGLQAQCLLLTGLWRAARRRRLSGGHFRGTGTFLHDAQDSSDPEPLVPGGVLISNELVLTMRTQVPVLGAEEPVSRGGPRPSCATGTRGQPAAAATLQTQTAFGPVFPVT